ncbi:restriction endonuclease [Bradyrhizobium sp. BRP19]|uniref:restriction endonuclease n=1 Tax=Bradyrhizobium sp. BRP19 TaxID=2793823 RepID=UPI001CD7805B|nr:restriction endonuclease [Bradyrhizobium sp. BRP19]MCA1549178.1 restriction endonuclease [Bradyrhizobium sp. BRP19]
MAFWVVRAGKHGVNEDYAVENNVAVIGWDSVGDLSGIATKEAMLAHVQGVYHEKSLGVQRIWAGELWAFKDKIRNGDWIAVPLTSRSAIAIGRVAASYRYVADAPAGAGHQRPVEWVRTDLPRSEIDQDLLYTLGSTLTVFQAKRNNAEERLAALVQGRTSASSLPRNAVDAEPTDTADDGAIDIEQFAADQITKFIGRNFAGHELARLVGEILKAEGYQVQVSKPGADGGVDVIAGTGPMGFGQPRIAVQVKSGATPADVSVLRELQGVMPRFGADHGLIVSWAGFKDSVIREARQLFFEVRLWDAGDLVAALQKNFDALSEELQAELPIKRIWLLVEPES